MLIFQFRRFRESSLKIKAVDLFWAMLIWITIRSTTVIVMSNIRLFNIYWMVSMATNRNVVHHIIVNKYIITINTYYCMPNTRVQLVVTFIL